MPITMETTKELKNQNVLVRIDADGLFCCDLTDIYNKESLFTQSKRGLKTCIAELTRGFNEDFTFKTIRNHLWAYNIRCHQYCGMD